MTVALSAALNATRRPLWLAVAVTLWTGVTYALSARKALKAG